MKSKTIELVVLSAGVLAIAIGVFMTFFSSKATGMYIMNFIYAGGFLLYIVYSVMSTNNLNREISQLQSHISSLKTDVQKQKQLLNEKTNELKSTTEEKDEIAKSLKKAEEEIKKYKQELASAKKKSGSAG